jgi:hypothetical protein
MEDTTMREGSPAVFEELSFTIYPSGLSEDRMRQVRDASDQLRSITDRPCRLNALSQARAEPLYLSKRPKAA